MAETGPERVAHPTHPYREGIPLAKIITATLAATLGTLALFLAATTATIAVIGSPTRSPITTDPVPDALGALCRPAGRPNVAELGADQIDNPRLRNAATIVAVGAQLGVPEQGWLVALTAALTESGLRNLPYGDRDSLGLFQQRPSQGWGTPAHILDPRYSATQFYRHLLALPHWQQMSINNAAQAVQRSATPTAYAPHEPAARALLHTLTHTANPPTPATSPVGGPIGDAVHPPTEHATSAGICPTATPCPPHPATATPPPPTRMPSTPTCSPSTSGAP